MSGSASKGPCTLQDLLAIPEAERRHELIEGRIIERGAGTFEHGFAQSAVSAFVAPFRAPEREAGPVGWWLATSVDVSFDSANAFCPDLAGWRRDRVPERPRGMPVTIIPDWVCEILSTNRRNDLIKKKRVYHRHRVGHHWIVDPEEGTLVVHRWGPDGYVEVLSAERGETVRAEPFDANELRVGVLFGDEG